jgi:hypothetical protein
MAHCPLDHSEFAARDSEFVRSSDLLPNVCGRHEMLTSRGRVILGQPQPALRQRGVSEHGSAADALGDRVELVGCRARSVKVAAGDPDLDLRGQQRRPVKVVVGRTFLGRNEGGPVECVPDGLGGGGHVTAPELKTGEGRLWIPPELPGLEERFLGA